MARSSRACSHLSSVPCRMCCAIGPGGPHRLVRDRRGRGGLERARAAFAAPRRLRLPAQLRGLARTLRARANSGALPLDRLVFRQGVLCLPACGCPGAGDGRARPHVACALVERALRRLRTYGGGGVSGPFDECAVRGRRRGGSASLLALRAAPARWRREISLGAPLLAVLSWQWATARRYQDPVASGSWVWGSANEKLVGATGQFLRYSAHTDLGMLLCLAACIAWPLRHGFSARDIHQPFVLENLLLRAGVRSVVSVPARRPRQHLVH